MATVVDEQGLELLTGPVDSSGTVMPYMDADEEAESTEPAPSESEGQPEPGEESQPAEAAKEPPKTEEPSEEPKKPEGIEVPKVPWDKERQKADQEFANLRKTVESLRQDIRELRSSRSDQPAEDPDKIVAELKAHKAKKPDADELDSGPMEKWVEEREALYGRLADARVAAASRATRTGPADAPPTEVSESSRESSTVPDPAAELHRQATQEDLRDIVTEARKAYGHGIYEQAMPVLAKQFADRKLQQHPPSVAALGDQVFRVFGETAAAARKPGPKPGTKTRTPSAAAPSSEGVPVPTPKSEGPEFTTVDAEVARMKRELKAGRNLR